MPSRKVRTTQEIGGQQTPEAIVGLLTSIFQEVRSQVTVSLLEGKAQDAFEEFQRIRAGLALTPAPVITSFTASPTNIGSGQSTTLSWTTENSKTVSIDNGIGVQPSPGSTAVTLNQTTTFTATAGGACSNSAPAQVTVTVDDGVDVGLLRDTPR